MREKKIEVPLTSHRRGITVLVAIAALLFLSSLTIAILYGKNGVPGSSLNGNVLAAALVFGALLLLLIVGMLLLDSLYSNRRKKIFINLEVPQEFTIHALGSKQEIAICGDKLEIYSHKKSLICHTSQILEARFITSRYFRAYSEVLILDKKKQLLASMSLRLWDYHLLRKYLILQGCSVRDMCPKW